MNAGVAVRGTARPRVNLCVNEVDVQTEDWGPHSRRNVLNGGGKTVAGASKRSRSRPPHLKIRDSVCFPENTN